MHDTTPPLAPQPDVTVAIMSYNNAGFIGTTIESALAQTDVALEVIVFDDCSSDDTLAVLERYTSDPRFRYEINARNLGMMGNYNRCVDSGSGRYVVVLGSDDVMYPGHLSSLFAALELHPEAPLAYTQCDWIDEHGALLRHAVHPGHYPHSYFGHRDEVVDLLIHDNYITPSAVMLRRSILDRIRLPDGNVHAPDMLAGDWELWIRIARQMPDFVFLRQATLGYRIHGGQVSQGFYKSDKPLAEHTRILEENLAEPSVRQRMQQAADRIWAHYQRRLAAYSPDLRAPFEARNKAIGEALLLSSEKGQSGATPLFSVIVTTYNRPRLLVDALASVASQTCRDFETIVVNDCGEPVEHLLGQFAGSTMHLVRHGTNRGLSAARNTGLALARGAYVVYLDDDDLMLPHHLATLAAEIQRTPDTIIYTDADYVGESIEDNRRIVHSHGNPLQHDSFSAQNLLVRNFIPVNTFCHPRRLIETIGLFNESFTAFEDWEFLIRASQAMPFHHLKTTTVEVRTRISAPGEHMLGQHKKDFPALYRKVYALHPSDDPVVQKSRAQFLASQEAIQRSTESSASNQDQFQAAYEQASKNRYFISEDINTINKSILESAPDPARIHIIIRLESGNEAALADTLDSLNLQFYAGWHLDVFTTLPSPEGLGEIPCLGWQTLETTEHYKEAIDFIVHSRKLDWVVELPAGVRLDALFLWRILQEGTANPEVQAIFVDDDCFNESGEQINPRLKPGVNIATLLSADLAGPLCVRRDIWSNSGGASPRSGSPWFAKLLQVAEQAGWNSVKHIPDTLLSYPGAFPVDFESCLLALVQTLNAKKIECEIIPVTNSGWCIRYALDNPPPISIAIISEGQLDILNRCIKSVIEKTRYPDFKILVSLTNADNDPEIEEWINSKDKERSAEQIRVVKTPPHGNHAMRCNSAIKASPTELVVLLGEDAFLIHENWLEELVRTMQQADVAAVSPRQVNPRTGLVHNVGSVLGFNGVAGNPYQKEVDVDSRGYLDLIQISRDVGTLSAGCVLIRSSAYTAVGGMDETHLGDHFAEIDLSLKLRRENLRLVYQPMATIFCGGVALLEIDAEIEKNSHAALAKAHATEALYQRWQKNALQDPFWNPNLSLIGPRPLPETAYRPRWNYLPDSSPRILARSLPNGQQIFRVTSPLRALRKAGMVSDCDWVQEGTREPSVAEIARLAPDAIIVQHYLHPARLVGLKAWQSIPGRPFTVYAIDDLITDIPKSNPFSKDVPSNGRMLIKYALAHCDRMVTSTDFLADTYRHLISDIRVVPNRLEQDVWLPLHGRKRTGKRPRIGWAGGTTHQGDLILLREVIESTRGEAEWIFFGMCPEEIRPLLSEYHHIVPFAEYPAKLAALNLDIAVAPLAELPFNQAKSNLRLLEYGALGVPVVCTDIDPYRNSPACCVKNNPAAWIEALRARIHDADGREREGAELRRWVHQNYLLENHLDEWLKAHLPD